MDANIPAVCSDRIAGPWPDRVALSEGNGDNRTQTAARNRYGRVPEQESSILQASTDKRKLSGRT